ncbi:hypothetical protein [Streptomyces sp. NPDC056405]|uniref:hypothetical protein n=1 Tax=Streptomyces sp. NPDC056405 TaxID=3345811 RepID=UPI0035E020DD
MLTTSMLPAGTTETSYDGRAASSSFGTDGDVPYMIYEAGERLAGSIAVARG